MWSQFEQIKRPLERTVIGGNVSPTTQYAQRASLLPRGCQTCFLGFSLLGRLFLFPVIGRQGYDKNLLVVVFSDLQVYEAMKQAKHRNTGSIKWIQQPGGRITGLQSLTYNNVRFVKRPHTVQRMASATSTR
jgi:hypothetical protein